MADPVDILRKHWGYDAFRPLQREIIDSVLSGNDTLGLLPTGGGKSITFQVPAMMLPGMTIVVTPLISLMKDQVDNLHARGIRGGALYTGMKYSESKLVLDRCALGKIRILYVSPERLQSERFLQELRQWEVSLLVVDEAHCISQWGHDFRPAYLNICKLRDMFPDVPVLALTASATEEVVEDIEHNLSFRNGSNRFVKSFDRENLSYIVRKVDNKEGALLRVLRSTAGTAIVYVRSRKHTVQISAMLAEAGISSAPYHAGLDALVRAERQESWKNDQIRVIVATNAFGMGIDKPDVRVVVHFDLPSSLEEYYQEAGRAGRDGKPAYAVVLLGDHDKATLTRRLSSSFPDKNFIRNVYQKACDFLGVCLGEGFNKIYEFDLRTFCNRFRLPPMETYSAMHLLSNAGYMEFIEDQGSRARVMVTVDRREFYGLSLDNRTEAVLTALLRNYTGLFADFVYIEETVLSLASGVDARGVYESLQKLDKMRVLVYVPKRTLPCVHFPTSREEPRHLLFPREVYEERRRSMERKIEAMKRFVDAKKCRSQVLLEYFGERGVSECGRCDVCREKRHAAPATDITAIRQMILTAASAPVGCNIMKLANAYPTLRTHIIDTARTLADEGLITLRSIFAHKADTSE